MRASLLLASTALLIPAALRAQTITLADMPQDGQHFQFIASGYQTITNVGENVTWDLSTLVPGDLSAMDCVLPSATGYETDFPTADLALMTTDIQQFVRLADTGMYVQGLFNGYSNALVKFDIDEYLFVPFPCAYGTNFQDDFAGSYDIGEAHVDVTGHLSFQADGYGTLVLPWGTLTNVLKLTGTEDEHEVYQGDDYGSYTQATYFFKPGVDFYIMKMSDLTTSLNDEPTGNYTFSTYLSQSSVGIAEAVRNDIGVDAFPVPAHDKLNVVYALDGGQATTLTLFDASGRVVRTLASATVSTGMQRAELDVTGLQAGLYLLQVTDARGQRGTRQVVLQ